MLRSRRVKNECKRRIDILGHIERECGAVEVYTSLLDACGRRACVPSRVIEARKVPSKTLSSKPTFSQGTSNRIELDVFAASFTCNFPLREIVPIERGAEDSARFDCVSAKIMACV